MMVINLETFLNYNIIIIEVMIMRKLIDFISGLFIGLSPDEIDFKRNLKTLSNEDWFKEFYNDARHFDKINSPKIREYLTKDGITEILKQDNNEREEFIKLLNKN
jgi:hypothetical protein